MLHFLVSFLFSTYPLLGTMIMTGAGGFVLFCLIVFTFSSSAQQRLYPEEKDRSAYLFVYFTGNRIEYESIHYAVSVDGYNFLALNNNRAIINSVAISSTGGVRDPHILRREDGNFFTW